MHMIHQCGNNNITSQHHKESHLSNISVHQLLNYISYKKTMIYLHIASHSGALLWM